MLNFEMGKKYIGNFGRKVNTKEELRDEVSKGYADNDAFMVEEIMILSKEEMQEFEKDFMRTYERFEGKGGSGSSFEIDREVEFMWELTKEELEGFKRGIYRKCIVVTNGESTYAVDPQGYDYARYIAEL